MTERQVLQSLAIGVGKKVPEKTDDRQHSANAKPSIRSFALTKP